MSSEFIYSLWITAIFILSSVLASLILGLALALAVSENIRGKGMIRSLLVLPAVIPPVVGGLAWKFLLNRDVGLLGGYILPITGFKTALLGNPGWALFSVVLADVWNQTPIMFLIILAGLQSISPEFYDAAMIDGANYWQILRKITIPLLTPVLIVASIIRFIFAFNAFDTIFIMTRGGPGISTQTLNLLGWKISFTYYNLGQGAALAVIMLIITIITATVLVKAARIE